MDDARKSNGPRSAGLGPVEKRPYPKPTVTDYGTVADLTRGGGTTLEGRHSLNLIRP